MACSTGKTKLSVRFLLIDDAHDRRRNDVRASASSCPIWKLGDLWKHGLLLYLEAVYNISLQGRTDNF